MKSLEFKAFLHAVGVAVYTALVVSAMFFVGSRTQDNYFTPVMFLLMFVLSAAVVGALVLGRPILMYVEGQKKEAIKMFIATIFWLAILTAIAFLSQVVA